MCVIKLQDLTAALQNYKWISKITLCLWSLSWRRASPPRRLRRRSQRSRIWLPSTRMLAFCMGKAMQHLAHILFVRMGNITLLRRDLYLDHLRPGVKPDTWCALCNIPLNCSGLFPDDVVCRAEDEIAKLSPDWAMAGMPLGSKISVSHIRVAKG